MDRLESKFETLYVLMTASADSERAVKMSAYMRDQFQFLGVATPQRKEITKHLYREAKKELAIDWRFVNDCWECPYREFKYVAIGYLSVLKKLLTPMDLLNLKKLAKKDSWWDTIDGLDRLVGEITFNYPSMKPMIVEWSTDEDFWLRRIAIDHQLLRKEKTDTELLEKIIIVNLHQKEFFINKAIGWSLRDYSKVNPAWVRMFIERHREGLSALSIREASKYL